ncbi:MAG TPA: hypothetical protein VLM79_12920 [Kofleriaceae bacterium]|nr:hypothetical protein [Kofleriaceae bacterium]
MNLVSDHVFRLLLSAVTGGVAAVWVIHDLVLIARLRGADRRDPLVADKRFGYGMGVVIGMIGVIGTLRFNGVL